MKRKWLVHEWGNKYQVVEAKVVVTKKPGFMSAGQKILAFEIENKSNAHLMAAAPDMYEFCRELWGALQRNQERIGAGRFVELERVLAKVEGK